MAWKLRVGAITFLPDGVSAQAFYYDDTILDPDSNPVIQYNATLTFPANAQPADIQARAIAVGQGVRRSFVLAQTLSAAAPPGTVIAIP